MEASYIKATLTFRDTPLAPSIWSSCNVTDAEQSFRAYAWMSSWLQSLVLTPRASSRSVHASPVPDQIEVSIDKRTLVATFSRLGEVSPQCCPHGVHYSLRENARHCKLAQHLPSLTQDIAFQRLPDNRRNQVASRANSSWGHESSIGRLFCQSSESASWKRLLPGMAHRRLCRQKNIPCVKAKQLYECKLSERKSSQDMQVSSEI